MRAIETTEELEKMWNETEALMCDFSAAWCEPCRMLEPLLRKLEKEHLYIVFLKVDIDENDELSEAYEVQSVPTLLFVRKRKVLRRMMGLQSYTALTKEARRLLSSYKNKWSRRDDNAA